MMGAIETRTQSEQRAQWMRGAHCRTSSLSFLTFLSLISLALSTTPTSAQMTGAPAAGYKREPAATASSMPPALRQIGFDQNVNQQLPLDAEFRDEDGRAVRLGDFFGSRPVVLAFVYYDCPMLCTQVLSAITSTLGVLTLDAGRDFEVVLVSFDPREQPTLAAAKKAEYLERYKRPGTAGGWHFLTGEEPAIKGVTAAAGFRYVWDADTKQFAHPTGIIVVTPDGRVARYLFGIEYGPRDLRFALLEATQGKVGSVVDSLLLFCYHYDPMTGRYGFVIMRALRIVAIATVLLLGAFIVVMIRRERAALPAIPPAGGAPQNLSA
jgi:protein SCO1